MTVTGARQGKGEPAMKITVKESSNLSQICQGAHFSDGHFRFSVQKGTCLVKLSPEEQSGDRERTKERELANEEEKKEAARRKQEG
jgi:hypothetical protein